MNFRAEFDSGLKTTQKQFWIDICLAATELQAPQGYAARLWAHGHRFRWYSPVGDYDGAPVYERLSASASVPFITEFVGPSPAGSQAKRAKSSSI